MHKSLAAMYEPLDMYFQTELFATAKYEIVTVELQNVKSSKFLWPGLER
jgi:hypothetical protein